MTITEFTGFSNKRNFNNSLIRFKGGWLMAYRTEGDWSNNPPSLFLCAVKDDLKTTLNHVPIKLDPPQPNSTFFEDPRLFIHKDQLWMSFICATLKEGHHYACQGLARLNLNGFAEEVFYPECGHNRNDVCTGNGLMMREKNWIFFSY